MKKLIQKLIDEMPIPFLKRYSIFTGSNSWLEWKSLLADYIGNRVDHFEGIDIDFLLEKIDKSFEQIYSNIKLL